MGVIGPVKLGRSESVLIVESQVQYEDVAIEVYYPHFKVNQVFKRCVPPDTPIQNLQLLVREYFAQVLPQKIRPDLRVAIDTHRRTSTDRRNSQYLVRFPQAQVVSRRLAEAERVERRFPWGRSEDRKRYREFIVQLWNINHIWVRFDP